MKTPSDFELNQLAHMYDAEYAKQYYLRTRKLKGRKKGQSSDDNSISGEGRIGTDPRTGKKKAQIQKDARAKQRKELATRINNLEGKLKKLEDMIKKMIREEGSEDRKGKAKKERAAKEADKPKSAAEKAEAARENEKYRDKNQQKLKGKKGADKKAEKASSKPEVSDLKALATKVKGKITIAKQKLAAL